MLADPAWSFNNKGSRATADNHYQTSPTRHFYRIPVEDWVRDNCALFCWTTDAHTREALDLIEVWGFNFKQWIPWFKVGDDGKVDIGMGNYFRHCTELCAFATRGKMKVSRKDIPAVIFAPRTRHSAKPEAIYRIAEIAFPEVPRLEMFARDFRPGWSAWGNEVPNMFQDGRQQWQSVNGSSNR